MACSSIQNENPCFPVPDNNVLTTFSHVMNSRSAYLSSHYFSDNIVLDWFGRTVVGRNYVLNFLFEELHINNHDIIEVKKPQENFQRTYSLQRALSRYRQPSLCEKDDEFDANNDSGIFEGCDSSFSSASSLTPQSKMASDFCRLISFEEEEDLFSTDSMSPILRTPLSVRVRGSSIPRRPPNGAAILRSLKQLDIPKNLKFIEAAGVLTFSSEDHIYSTGSVYQRPCHMQIGYCAPSPERSCVFSFLLYNDEMPCRRNLSHIFDMCD